jgi:hypothetical protein
LNEKRGGKPPLFFASRKPEFLLFSAKRNFSGNPQTGFTLIELMIVVEAYQQDGEAPTSRAAAGMDRQKPYHTRPESLLQNFIHGNRKL